MIDNLPKLGVGIGFRSIFKSELFLNRSSVDFLEIIADHYLDAAASKHVELDLLKKHFTLVPHGINLSLGSAEGVNEEYLDKLVDLIEIIKPPWFSEHLCFTKAGGIDIGHLSPLPFTTESVKVLVKNISNVKKRVKCPLIVENITYMFRYPTAEMDEADFLRTVLEETDCGLLLDVTNLYINSVNHGYDWRKFLEKLPLERVVQLHFVGGHRVENYLIDSHSQKTQAEIWEVFREVCSQIKVKGAILERDENFPPFNLLVDELNYARQIFEQTVTKSRASSNQNSSN